MSGYTPVSTLRVAPPVSSYTRRTLIGFGLGAVSSLPVLRLLPGAAGVYSSPTLLASSTKYTSPSSGTVNGSVLRSTTLSSPTSDTWMRSPKVPKPMPLVSGIQTKSPSSGVASVMFTTNAGPSGPSWYRSMRTGASAARQLPTVHRVLRQGQRNGRADLHAVVIEEGQRDLAAVARRLVRRAHAPAEHDREILRVQLRGREAGGEQIDRLLGKTERDRTREEVAAAFEGAWIARPGCAAHVHVPAGDAGLEVRVRQQVGLEAGDAGAREALIRERVGGVDGGTRESLPGHEAEDAVVVQGPIHEPRLGPQRIHDCATDRVQVELGDVGLEVEDIGEVLGPVRHAAGAAGVKVVEVAPEAGLTVVGHEDVVAALRPEDVAPHLDVARAVVDADVVALGRVERVADDPHVALAADRDRRLRVAVDQIVGDELAAAGGDADRIPRDAVGLDGAGEIHAGDVRLDEVRLVQIAAAQHARSGHPGGVGEDVLILHRAGEADAGGIAVDVVRQRGPDEPEAPRVADGGDDAGGVVVDAVGAESDRGSVLDADGRPVEIVPLDHGAGRRRWVDENIFRGEQRLDLLRAQGAAEDRDFVEATVDEAHALRLPYRQGRIDVRDGPDIGGRTHGRSVRVDGVRAPAPRQRQLVPLPCRERERDGSEEDGPRRRTVEVEAESDRKSVV